MQRGGFGDSPPTSSMEATQRRPADPECSPIQAQLDSERAHHSAIHRREAMLSRQLGGGGRGGYDEERQVQQLLMSSGPHTEGGSSSDDVSVQVPAQSCCVGCLLSTCKMFHFAQVAAFLCIAPICIAPPAATFTLSCTVVLRFSPPPATHPPHFPLCSHYSAAPATKRGTGSHTLGRAVSRFLASSVSRTACLRAQAPCSVSVPGGAPRPRLRLRRRWAMTTIGRVGL